MKIPSLHRPMTLKQRVSIPDDMGGQSQSWQDLGMHWCALISRGAGLRLLADVAQSVGNLRIILRAMPQDAPSRPVVGQRFVDGDRQFDIISVAETDDSGLYLECRVNEVQR